ncbi:5'-AMP-activated protein kinase subunit beta-2-like [Amphiura filiformis]|uniref:5'-AMP-activated protein kinase subunit beta-2-like n=1 Tax=Amphiura filiformis TaxID=82378 RepID=UPI003B222A9E
MGNTGGKRESRDSGALSPTKEIPPNSFDFKPGKSRILQHGSLDDSMDLQAGIMKELLEQQKQNQRIRATTMGFDQTMGLESNMLPVVFRWEGGGRNVYVSGSFNNWRSKIPMNKSHGDFTAIVDLPEGEHQYKFHVDGSWVHDTKQPIQSNEFGTVNNMVKVQKSDFEVFEALALDSSNSKQKDDIGTPPGDYSQEVPSREFQEKYSGPPILPPHLLQVILNKDIGPQYEPALLPEPNHVMLNHLYALSIKDGVMVLSATHRYRKKYVTTLLYKPI